MSNQEYDFDQDMAEKEAFYGKCIREARKIAQYTGDGSIAKAIRRFVFGKGGRWELSHRWVTMHFIEHPELWIIQDHFDRPGEPFVPPAEDLIAKTKQDFSYDTYMTKFWGQNKGIFRMINHNEEIIADAVIFSGQHTKEILTRTFGLTAVITDNGDSDLMPQYAVNGFINTLPSNTRVLRVMLNDVKGVETFQVNHLNCAYIDFKFLDKHWLKGNRPSTKVCTELYQRLESVLIKRFDQLFVREVNGDFLPSNIWGRNISETKQKELADAV
jgi:hypothetical protein